MRKLYLIILIAGLYICANAQEKNENASQPLELPNFIIEGKEQVSVRAGVKQFPQNPGSVGGIELDSLNSLEKQPSLLLPTVPLPTSILDHSYQKGWFKGSFGNFTTGKLNAGYEYTLNEYRLFGDAGYEISEGWTENSDYDRLFVNLNSDYIAAKKFWIFGGSKTRTNLSISNDSYNLYALDSATGRGLFNINTSVMTDGNYDGFLFNTGAGFRSTQLSQDVGNAFDNNIYGFLSVKRLHREFEYGLKADIDLHSVRGDGLNYFEASAFGGFLGEKFSLKGGAGIQIAEATNGEERGGIMFMAEMEYNMSRFITIKGALESGIRKQSFRRMSEYNPYINHSAELDYMMTLPAIKGLIWFHPNEKISAVGGVEIISAERMPVFVNPGNGTFGLFYDKANQIRIFAESFFTLPGEQKIAVNAEFNYAGLDSTGDAMPYLPDLKISGNYSKKWFGSLTTRAALIYYGERYADLENKIVLDPFIDLRLNFNYEFTDSFNVFINFENLLNSDIFIWEDYKERGTFFAAGLTWQFN